MKVEDPNVSVDPGELIYIGAWIDVGVVGDDGLPLFGTGPSFTLTASSTFDGRGDAWTFILAMEEVKRVALSSKHHAAIAPAPMNGWTSWSPTVATSLQRWD